MLYAASLSYYAQLIAQAKMATRPLGAHYELAGSSGIIGYKPKIANRFGVPTGLSAGGMNCDLIDRDMVQETDNDPGKRIQANQQIGIIGSSLEHQVLEQLFATHGEQAFSAVKAIQLANLQGQKIYTITKDNYEETLPMLHLAPAAIADIQAAAQAGLTVTTHERRISINGYTGEGYIILNEWGDGAYMINGGLYGASLRLVLLGSFIAALSIFLGPVMQFIFLGAAVGLVAAGIFLINGNKMACFATTFMSLQMIYKSITPKWFKGLGQYENMLKPFIKLTGFLSAKGRATKYCLCDIEPKCFK